MSTNATHHDDEEHSLADIPAGRRFVSRDSVVWAIEQELLVEGVELQNRAIPMEYHGLDDPDDIRDAIEEQSAAMHPNRNAIGYLNERLAEVTD